MARPGPLVAAVQTFVLKRCRPWFRIDVTAPVLPSVTSKGTARGTLRPDSHHRPCVGIESFIILRYSVMREQLRICAALLRFQFAELKAPMIFDRSSPGRA